MKIVSHWNGQPEKAVEASLLTLQNIEEKRPALVSSLKAK